MAASTLSIKLRDGTVMPGVAFGTWRGRNQECDLTPAITHALRVGYRAIDTAVLYKTEDQVGQAMKDAGVKREDVWIQTKLWPDTYEPATLQRTVDEALQRLQTTYVDCLMLHWPVFGPECEGYPTMEEVWAAVEEVHNQGKAKHLGISNFQPWHMDKLMSFAKVLPAINQCEMSPWWPQQELAAACRKHGIVMQAYRPFGNLAKKGALGPGAHLMIDEPALVQVANRHGATVNQVVLSWITQQGIAVVAKSATPERIEANMKLIKLSDEDLRTINSMQHREKACPAPFDVDVLALPLKF